MSNKHKSGLKSNCCNATAKADAYIADDTNQVVETMYFRCTECGEACDVHSNERKVWKINPETRIIPNKRRKELTDREVRDYLLNEDF